MKSIVGKKYTHLISLLLVGLALVAQDNAAAQELDEIVVTARMRSESLLDAPVTVSVFTRDTIEKAGN